MGELVGGKRVGEEEGRRVDVPGDDQPWDLKQPSCCVCTLQNALPILRHLHQNLISLLLPLSSGRPFRSARDGEDASGVSTAGVRPSDGESTDWWGGGDRSKCKAGDGRLGDEATQGSWGGWHGLRRMRGIWLERVFGGGGHVRARSSRRRRGCPLKRPQKLPR